MSSYLDRLAARIEGTGSVLCVGVDPDPAALPDGFPSDLEGIARFARMIVDATQAVAAAFKPNLAYFEAFGADGLRVLESLRAAIPADIPVVADAKRGDIGSTADKHVRALVDMIGADAVTVSPYLGRDALVPFVDRGAFAYVLCRTSNPSAGEFQDLRVADGDQDEPLYARVARTVEAWDAGRGSHGLVVGATAPEEMAEIRSAAPSLPFLVPGLGAQGGSLEATLRDGPARAGRAAGLPGGLVLVNVSRGIAQAATGLAGDPETALAGAARSWALRLRVLDSTSAQPRGI